MRVLMFGWEFPPFNKGGLGVACHGLTKGLSHEGVDVTFVIPKAPGSADGGHVNLVVASHKKIKIIDSPIVAYMTSDEYRERILSMDDSKGDLYGRDLFAEVERYALRGAEIAKEQEFDVIHAHDWLTYKAGIKAKEVSGKPLVVHMHATEFDRTGGNGRNQAVYDIEKEGLEKADRICAVSQFTKNKIIEHYGISPEKIEVVHNAVEFPDHKVERAQISADEKVVLFLGRITLQKGPDYFVDVAKKVLSYEPKTKFVVAGSGDMMPQMIDRAVSLGIADKMLFAGFLKGADIDRAYKMADLYVMPSVSEPFGITPLEAMRNGTPVLISKQSGVSEVISNCHKVDFWDVDEMTNKIVATLRYQVLHKELSENGAKEVLKFNWDEPARKCVEVYRSVLE